MHDKPIQNHPMWFGLNPKNHIIEIKKSPIHGFGIFSKKELPADFMLGPAFVDRGVAKLYEENLAGNYEKREVDDNWIQVIGNRYLNHSEQPNIKFQFNGKFIMAVVIKKIAIGDEITVNYLDYYSHTKISTPAFLKNKKTC